MGSVCSREGASSNAQTSKSRDALRRHSSYRIASSGKPIDVVTMEGPSALGAAAIVSTDEQGQATTRTRESAAREAGFPRSNNITDYFASRDSMIDSEKSLGFEYHCRQTATELELQVDSILHRLRKQDQELVYKNALSRSDENGQFHKRFEGDHFLSNLALISQTSLFAVAQRMPKGGHLHIHFNACLPPHVLLDIAKENDRMFIKSSQPLLDSDSLASCEIQFSLLTVDKEDPGNLFDMSYEAGQTMRFQDFRKQFRTLFSDKTPDMWLAEKMVFHDSEAHNSLQTAKGAWQKFNGRTRMMKGLFNYEAAYRKYTRLCLEDFMHDNIQYAEIRPNFMRSNQLYRDDGSGLIDNWGIMEIIIDEVHKFQSQLEMEGDGRFFGGLKVIYCTPRSLTSSEVEMALEECLGFKRKWPNWIAGFDLVGEEAKGKPIKDFVPQLLHFRQQCEDAGLDIPFLFHCGETLDIGTDVDLNLVDALLLKSKRIGHGFALKHHPLVMQRMKEENICVELCPISNEVLGLTPRVGGHAMYTLLANNVHCTVSSDNGTLFRSTLSHDFYQVLVGKADMSVFGWKQLILWSLQHACLDEDELSRVQAAWEQLWQRFLLDIVTEFRD